MKKFLTSFYFAVIIVLLLSLWFLLSRSSEAYVEIGEGKLRVEVVDTPATRERGLSGRSGLGEKEGMLFVFERPGQYPFWMKDMHFPIDILWINDKKEIIHIEKNVRPDSYPASFMPPLERGEARYVLEAEAGFSDRYNLQVGDKAKINH